MIWWVFISCLSFHWYLRRLLWWLFLFLGSSFRLRCRVLCFRSSWLPGWLRNCISRSISTCSIRAALLLINIWSGWIIYVPSGRSEKYLRWSIQPILTLITFSSKYREGGRSWSQICSLGTDRRLREVSPGNAFFFYPTRWPWKQGLRHKYLFFWEWPVRAVVSENKRIFYPDSTRISSWALSW